MRWALAFILVALALPGVIATSWLVLPQLVDPAAMPVPLETLQVAAAAQGALFVLIAAVLGSALGDKVGLHAPVLSAAIGRGGVVDAWRPQILPGLAGGVIGAAIIVAFYAFSPEPLAEAVQGRGAVPLAARILYGGITEEVLMRWGLMTVFVWVGWRLFQRGAGKPSDVVVWLAIAASALLFGISHLPSVAGGLVALPASVIVYVTLGNAIFGVVAGYLFWRNGLEAAIAAHILAHAFAYMVRG